jgi:hypothetical protein
MYICGFENKDVHAIDYASGDIVYEFIFKDDTISKQDDHAGSGLGRHGRTAGRVKNQGNNTSTTA